MQFKTLHQFLVERSEELSECNRDIALLMMDLALAAKVVNRAVHRVGLQDLVGQVGTENIFGEEQQKLDILAQHAFVKALRRGRECRYLISEECEGILDLGEANMLKRGDYVVCIDPLDGSSNIDIHGSVGTIFSVYRSLHQLFNGNEGTVAADRLSGKDQIAAGYILYGSSTMFVFTTGQGTHGFTLDPSIGEFCLSHPAMQVPQRGDTYSINEGHLLAFTTPIRQYLDYCKAKDIVGGRPYKARYIGAMVADIHRILLKGGVFLYPNTSQYPRGKLRLLYECNPMAFLLQQAGGMAVDGIQDVMIIDVKDIHQCTAFVGGSKGMVKDVVDMCTQAYLHEK